jgi:hypothetical protein
MNAFLFIDGGEAFARVGPETLTDGSQVWNIHFRSGEEFHYASESDADEAFALINQAARKSINTEVLCL